MGTPLTLARVSSALPYTFPLFPGPKAIKAPGWKLASNLLEVRHLSLPALFNFIF